MTRSAHPAEALLVHRDFVRRIAASLLDANGADDLCQDTWVAALLHPPHDGGAARSWLATVARNLFSNQRRLEAHRKTRERAAAASGSSPPVDEIVAREEARRAVVAAVLALPAHLREVVLLRYYEDLDSTAIGQHLGRPAGSVRRQLHDALQQLRGRLDSEHGERAAWAVPLLWWHNARLGDLAALLRVAWPLRAAAVALVAIAAMLLLPQWWSSPQPLPAGMPGPVVAQQPTQVSDQETLARTAVTAALPEPSTPMHFQGDLPHGSLRGCVVTAELREPVAGATVKLRSLSDCLPAGLTAIDSRDVARTAKSGADGAFAFADLPGGAYELRAGTANGCSAKIRMAIGEGEQQVTLALAPPDPFRGLMVVKVVDPNRLPVEGAEVAIAGVTAAGSAIGWHGAPPITGRTGRDGVFRLEDPSLEKIKACLVLARSGAAVGMAQKWHYSPRVEVVVDQPGILAGRLVGLPGHDWSHSTVRLHATMGADGVAPDLRWATFRTRPDRDGGFCIDGLPAASYEVQLDAAGVALAVPGRDPTLSLQVPRVAVAAGATVSKTFAVGAGAMLKGRVVDPGGAPVPGAEVTVRLRWQHDPDDFYRHLSAQSLPPAALRSQLTSTFALATASTDAEGRYEFTQLQPGRHDVLVLRAGLGIDALPCVAIAAGATVALEHHLVVGGMIRGIAGPSWVGIRDASGAGCLHMVQNRDGFQLAGLPPGRCEVDFRSGVGEVIGPRRTVEVTAGAAVWVDLRQAHDCIVEGTLFAEGVPMAGIEVRGEQDGWARAVSAADGSFTLPAGDLAHGGTVTLRCLHRGIEVGTTRIDGPFSGPRRLGSIELAARRVEFQVLDPRGQPIDAVIEVNDVPLRVPGGVLREQWVRAGELVVGDHVRQEAPYRQNPVTGSVVQVPMTGEVAPIVIRRQPTGAVRVRVVDADGAAWMAAEVRMVEWELDAPAPEVAATFAARARGERSCICATDRDGYATVRSLHAVPVLLYVHQLDPTRPWFVYRRPYAFELSPPPADQIVTVCAGETAEVTLRLPR